MAGTDLTVNEEAVTTLRELAIVAELAGCMWDIKGDTITIRVPNYVPMLEGSDDSNK